MGREFELSKEVELEASPKVVWDAIATGPGVDSWFMGPHTVEPGVGGKMPIDLGPFHEESTITAWDPPKRFAYKTEPGPDSTFHAMEYLVEGREGGSTALRFVHNGFLSDEWGTEYASQTSHGWDMYLHTLGQYVKYFPGKPGTYVFVQAPEATDAWDKLLAGLSLEEPYAAGDPVHLTLDGLPPIDGVIDFAVPGFRELLGICGTEGLYCFHRSGPSIGLGHHAFGEPHAEAWQSWAVKTFS